MKLLTGNDLATGDVTWWTGNGWSRHVEDAVDVGLRNSDSLVLDGDDDPTRLAEESHGHRVTGFAVLDGIVDEVRRSGQQLCVVPRDDEASVGYVGHDPNIGCRGGP